MHGFPKQPWPGPDSRVRDIVLPRPSLTDLTPMQANHIVATVMDYSHHYKWRVESRSKNIKRSRLYHGNEFLPDFKAWPVKYYLSPEIYEKQILSLFPKRSDMHGLLEALGHYALASLGYEDITETEIARYAPVLARAWDTLDEAKKEVFSPRQCIAARTACAIRDNAEKTETCTSVKYVVAKTTETAQR